MKYCSRDNILYNIRFLFSKNFIGQKLHDKKVFFLQGFSWHVLGCDITLPLSLIFLNFGEFDLEKPTIRPPTMKCLCAVLKNFLAQAHFLPGDEMAEMEL